MMKNTLISGLIYVCSCLSLLAVPNKNLYIDVTVNKKSVYEQEPVLITYKVYTQVDLIMLEGNMPDINGFHAVEVDLPFKKEFHHETRNGSDYNSVIWNQYVAYPQAVGNLEIPKITYKGTVVVNKESSDPFENFFNGGGGYVEEERTVVAPAITIHVEPLPPAPKDFSGGVGVFDISASLDRNDVKAGEPVTLRVTVSGRGNLKLLKVPEVAFPNDFERYDARVTDSVGVSPRGYAGSVTYDFKAVPLNIGRYVIPAVSFTYFDLDSDTYQTVRTLPFNLTVKRGDGGIHLDSSIRTIKSGESGLRRVSGMFFGSWKHWALFALLLIAYVVCLIMLRRRAAYRADIRRVRYYRAGKLARKRLVRAERLMDKGIDDEACKEVLRALWGFVADKMGLDVANLSDATVRDALLNVNVDEDVTNRFFAVLDYCRLRSYARSDDNGGMGKICEEAERVIEEMENVINNVSDNSKKGRKNVWLMCLFVLMALPVGAVTKTQGDQQYLNGNYQQAISDYRELLKEGVSAELYYNLGNAYYQTRDYQQAVAAYEKAHMLAPSDDDIYFNLLSAYGKIRDDGKAPDKRGLLSTWYGTVVHAVSTDGWMYIGIASLVGAMLLSLSYLLSHRVAIRKWSFWCSLFLFVLFAICHILAFCQQCELAEMS